MSSPNSEQRRMEEALRESEARFRALFDQANDAIFMLHNGVYADCNAKCQQMYRRSHDQIIGHSPGEFSPPTQPDGSNSRDKASEIVRKAMTGEAQFFEWTISLPDGATLLTEVSLSRLELVGKVYLQAILRDITERKQAEKVLYESEMRFRTLIDQSPVAIGVSRKGTGIYANQKFSQLFGLKSLDESIGRHVSTYFAPEFQKESRERVERRTQGLPAPHEFESIGLRADGSTFPMRVQVAQVNLADGMAEIGFITDITERKAAEENNIRSLALLRATLDSTADGILTIGSDRQIISFNETFVKMWRIPASVLATKDDALAIQCVVEQLQFPERFLAKVRYLYDHPLEGSYDVLDFKDGRVFERYSRPMHVEGRPIGRVWSFRDITERKRAEKQIAEQAALLDNAQDAIVVRDLRGEVLFWNKGAERMYEWTRQEVLGQNILQLLHTDPKKFDEINGVTLSEGEWHGELQHVTKAGHHLVVEVRCSLIRDELGRPKSVLSINTDITEKKKIEAQFMRAQRMESIGTLAGGIAHDLNNILAPIMMSIEILKRSATDPQARGILETIGANSKRGADIVRQVLSFARGLEGERVEIKPGDLLKEIEAIIKDTFPKKIRLGLSLPENSWKILGDPTQLHQILLNLSLNARDAMPEGGNLTLTVENTVFDQPCAATHLQARAGRYVMISVTDSGMGIPPANIDKIFEPFFTTKEVGKGTGIGLSTVLAIVKSHGGFINVSSEAGKGTAFKVYFPAMETISQASDDAGALPSLPRGYGEMVLIVDDEISVLDVTGQTLEAFGYRVLTAENGEEAMAVYAKSRDEISAVLCDMVMPVMDGPATVRALKKANPAVKIMVASGSATRGSMAKEPASGIKYFLSKPYTAGTLLKALRAMLDEDAEVASDES